MKKQFNSFKAEAIPTAQLQNITGGEGDCRDSKATGPGSKTFGEGLPGAETRKYSSDCVDCYGTHYTWVPNQGMVSGGGGINTDLATTNDSMAGAFSFNP